MFLLIVLLQLIVLKKKLGELNEKIQIVYFAFYIQYLYRSSITQYWINAFLINVILELNEKE